MIDYTSWGQSELIVELQKRDREQNGYYIVHRVSLYDVQQATGNDKIVYTEKQMKDLAEYLEEETYNGDEWCDAINKFNDNLE